MDTSEEYIEMCRKADEIQKLSPTTDDFTRRPISISKEGNWFYIQSVGSIGYNSIWLPRQDQLQDMLDKESQLDIMSWDEMGCCIVLPSYNFGRNNDCEIFNRLEVGTLSWGQIWLMIVMHEKYGKRWDGTDWVVE